MVGNNWEFKGHDFCASMKKGKQDETKLGHHWIDYKLKWKLHLTEIKILEIN